ncbi:CYP315A1 (predicted) [Pycnogonum litorale]
MPYVKAIVKESLRMYPVAPFLTRILTKDVELGGYCIPKGKLVMMPLFTTCRNSKYFNSPDEFRPERWLRKEGSREVLTTHACLPFGLGTRSCVGRRIAETQMYLLLAKTVRDYELTSANAQEVDINLRLITVPSEPIKLKMTERRS